MTQDDRMETITDPAVIRACDEPDERGERGDFPCCTDRAHKESLGGDSESGTYNRSNRPPAGPCTDERTTPAPSSGAGLDLDALHETICDKFTGMAEVRQAADLLVAEVRRLTEENASYADELLTCDREEWRVRAEAAEADVQRLASDAVGWKRLYDAATTVTVDNMLAVTRAESAEAEVVTLRAKVAALQVAVSHSAESCADGPCEFHETVARAESAEAKVAAVQALAEKRDVLYPPKWAFGAEENYCNGYRQARADFIAAMATGEGE